MKEVDKKTYELIAEEIDTGNTQRALWTKAFSDAEGDDNRTKALYIKYRFEEISNEEQEYHGDEGDDDGDSNSTTSTIIPDENSDEDSLSPREPYLKNKESFGETSSPKNSLQDEAMTASEAVKDGNQYFLDYQNKISTQKRVEKYVSDMKKQSYPKVTPKIGGFLHVVGFVLLMATYKWVQIFSWEFNEGRVEGNQPNLAIILLLLAILVNLYLLYKFFSKKISFVTNFLWLSSLKLAVIIIYFNDKILEVEMLGKTSSHPSPWPEAWLWVYLFYLVSAIYLLVSKRVKQTFVN